MSARPSSAFVGPGRLAQALAPALAEAGWPVVAVGARDPSRAQDLARSLPGCRALPLREAAQSASWVWLCVPDGALTQLAAGLPWRAGQVVLHAAGATGLDVLAPARAAGARVAGFHPLQLFAGGRADLAGCGVGIETEDDTLRADLLALAASLGLQPLLLRPETRALYHAGANLAASGVLAVLAEAQAVWAAAGLSAADAQALLRPLTEGALAAATRHGLAGAVSGPVARGDAAVLRIQLARLRSVAPAQAELYRLLSLQQLQLAEQAGRLSPDQRQQLDRLLRNEPEAP